MNTVQNGKGDRARNNWGAKWDAGYAAINWHRAQRQRTLAPVPGYPTTASDSQLRTGSPRINGSSSSSSAGAN